jgi:hypothetical protein
MIIALFLAALAVSLVLDHQARRHCAERREAYSLLRIPEPPPAPRLKRTEAWLNVGLGCLVAALGGSSAWMMMMRNSLVNEHGAPSELIASETEWETAALFGALGFSLVVMGVKALREIYLHEKGGVRPAAPSRAQFRPAIGIAAGVFLFAAGMVTSYYALPRAGGAAPETMAGVLVRVDARGEVPAEFASEIRRRIEADLGTIPGVRVVRGSGGATPAYIVEARLVPRGGQIDVSWEVTRSRDNRPVVERGFQLSADPSAGSIAAMSGSVAAEFRGSRKAEEYERMLNLPGNSLRRN